MIITGSSYEMSSTNLKWLPLAEILDHRDLTIMFKVLEDLAPNYLRQMFNVCDNQLYDLRSIRIHLSLQIPETNFLKRRFSYRGAASWNNLDEHIQSNFTSLSLNSFKAHLLN